VQTSEEETWQTLVGLLTEGSRTRDPSPYGGTTYEEVWALQGRPRTSLEQEKFPAQLHEELISLIYTRPGSMSHPRGPCTSGESKSELPPHMLASLRYTTEVFHSDRRENQPEHPHEHYHRNPHTRSKSILL